MKPDSELGTELESGERIRMAPLRVVHRYVAQLAERVKKVGGFLRNDPIIAQASERLLKWLPFVAKDCVVGGDELGEEFG